MIQSPAARTQHEEGLEPNAWSGNLHITDTSRITWSTSPLDVCVGTT